MQFLIFLQNSAATALTKLNTWLMYLGIPLLTMFAIWCSINAGASFIAGNWERGFKLLGGLILCIALFVLGPTLVKEIYSLLGGK